MVTFFYAVRFFIRATFVFLIASLVIRVLLMFVYADLKTGWRRFVLKVRVSLLLLIALAIVGHCFQAFFQRFTEWSPQHISQEVLVGTWVKGKSRLHLNDDGTASYYLRSSRGVDGSEQEELLWELEESRLILKNPGGRKLFVWRIILFSDEYRILDEDKESIHLGNLGFGK